VTYEAAILATSPVLYLPMQGSTITEEVRSVTATVTGATVQQAGPVAGMDAISFDGANDSVSVATHTSYHPGDTFSIGGWVNRTAAGDGSGAAIYHAGSGELTVWFPPSGGNLDKLTLRKAGTGDVFASTTVYDSPYNDGWFHFIYTKSGSTRALYINGVSEGAAGTNQTIVATTDAPTFGNSTTNTLDFAGRLAHMAIWSVALTSTQAEDLYDATFVSGGGGARSQAIIIG
jgi:hypothetical protein